MRNDGLFRSIQMTYALNIKTTISRKELKIMSSFLDSMIPLAASYGCHHRLSVTSHDEEKSIKKKAACIDLCLFTDMISMRSAIFMS